MALGKFREIANIAHDAVRAEFGVAEASDDEATQLDCARDIQNLCKEILRSPRVGPEDFHDEASEPNGILRTNFLAVQTPHGRLGKSTAPL